MNFSIIHDVSLKQYNTMRLEAEASMMAFPHTTDGLIELMKTYQDKKEIIIIGRGSNVLLKKTHYSENYLFVNLKLLDHMELKGNELSVECGATLSSLVWYGVENGLSGLEYLEDIPGTIGGAILMNAGTYKNYIGDLIKSVTYYDYDSKSVVTREKQDGDFGRRMSFWTHNKSIVLSCALNVKKGNYLDSLDEVMKVKKDRFTKQPRNYPSAGSVFVRPKVDLKDMVVWELLDKVDLRGFSYGGAAFSDKHPGFIINQGNATYQDIIHLIDVAKDKVKEQFGVELSVEWNQI